MTTQLLPEELAAVRFGADGLVAAVVQDADSLDVLMVAYMDEEALRRTLTSGATCFWSRSRGEYWVKGATSGNTQAVVDVRYDCDGDCLLVLVRQEGVACHTGERSCFYRSFGRGTAQAPSDPPARSGI
ncbi:MAG: phosphoribosyl-AMP cyclohydrolase [Acidimicrobiia bacterium]|nr:phosphoribosyl-AMP cyclohydrolase [Acidimicrobiia bacterium]